MSYPHLFSEWQIRNTTIPNRVVFAPTCPTWVASPYDGIFTDQAVAYYEERAKGGCGLIIIGGTVIHPSALYSSFLFPGLWDDKQIDTQTRFEQRAGEVFVRIGIDFDNPCEDQRVRVHVPLRESADRSFAEGQFAVVERGLEAEGGYGEVAVPTQPASSFVIAGGIALLLDHVTEYEVLGDELALTVLRSTGFISRNQNPWREDPAGPELPIPAAQLRGPHSFSFAWYPSTEAIHEQAEQYRHPFLTARGRLDAQELRSHAGPKLEADSSVVLTALQRGRARLVNESALPQTVRFAGDELELRPWEIRTIQL